jgi:hypothetical protein
MGESELVLNYGLSVGAGLAVALIVYGISEYFRHPSRISVYAWIDPSASERKGLSIFVDNQTNSRTVVCEAGTILEDGRHIRVTARNEPHSGEPRKPFPVTIAAHEQVTVSIVSLSEENISIGLAACYVIRDRNRLITGPVHAELG